MESYSSMSQVIDSPIERLTRELEKLGYTELLNFKKMVEIQYQELEQIKNQLLEKEDDTEEVKEVVEDVYKLLQKVEDIATVTEELKKQRKIED